MSTREVVECVLEGDLIKVAHRLIGVLQYWIT